MSEFVVLKVALVLHDPERLKTLLDEPCDCGHCESLSERDQILAILGIADREVTICGVAEDEGKLYPTADTGIIVDARIENRHDVSRVEDRHNG